MTDIQAFLLFAGVAFVAGMAAICFLAWLDSK